MPPAVEDDRVQKRQQSSKGIRRRKGRQNRPNEESGNGRVYAIPDSWSQKMNVLDMTERIMRSEENIPDAWKMIDSVALANAPIPGECPEERVSSIEDTWGDAGGQSMVCFVSHVVSPLCVCGICDPPDCLSLLIPYCASDISSLMRLIP